MANISSIAKKYDLTERDFDSLYYSTLNMVKRVNGKINEDLFVKYMYDKLEEQGIEYRDADRITSYYQEELEFYQKKKENKVIEKIMEIEDDGLIQQTVEEEMQTSGDISDKIGMNRKHGYKTKVIDMYEGEDEDDDEEDEEDF